MTFEEDEEEKIILRTYKEIGANSDAFARYNAERFAGRKVSDKEWVKIKKDAENLVDLE